MNVILNGQAHGVDDGATVKQLLDELQLDPRRCAVEVNLDLVPRRRLAEHVLHQDDRIEVVTFVGGG